MIEIVIMACILGITFGMGIYVGATMERQRRRRRRRSEVLYSDFGNFMPQPNPDPQFDEEHWIHNQPRFPMGGSAGERAK